MADAVRLEPVGFARVSRDFGLRMPRAVLDEVRRALRQDMRAARARLQANVRGGFLRTGRGRLAESIRTSIRASGAEVAAKAGSKLYYGRFWDEGFTRRGRAYAPRPWATSVMDAMRGHIEANIEAAIRRALER